MDRVWLGIVCGAAIGLLTCGVVGDTSAAVLGACIFVFALAGGFHREWNGRWFG